jgi:hypothetical protein
MIEPPDAQTLLDFSGIPVPVCPGCTRKITLPLTISKPTVVREDEGAPASFAGTYCGLGCVILACMDRIKWLEDRATNNTRGPE